MTRQPASGDYQSEYQGRVGITPPDSSPAAERTVASLPEQWRQRVPTRIPVWPAWAKKLESVDVNAHAARHYRGEYITWRRGYDADNRRQRDLVQFPMHIGELVLICVAGEPEQLALYLYMPGDFWYRTPIEPVVRTDGWAAVLRQPVREWLALTYRQRIVRACTETILACRESQERLARDRARRVSSATELEWLNNIIEQFTDLRHQALDEVNNLAEESILASFDSWVNGVQQFTMATQEDVMDALSDALYVRDNAEIAQEIDEALAAFARCSVVTAIDEEDNGTLLGRAQAVRRCADTAANLLNMPSPEDTSIRLPSETPGAYLRRVLRNPELRLQLENDNALYRLVQSGTANAVRVHLRVNYHIDLPHLRLSAIQRAFSDAGVHEAYWREAQDEPQAEQPRRRTRARRRRQPQQRPTPEREMRNIRIRRSSESE